MRKENRKRKERRRSGLRESLYPIARSILNFFSFFKKFSGGGD